MPINFGILQQLAPEKPLVEPLQQTSSGGSSGSDNGLQDLFSGISGILGKMAPKADTSSVGPTAAPINTNISPLSLNTSPTVNGQVGALGNTQGIGLNAPQKGFSGNLLASAQRYQGLHETNPALKAAIQKANPGLDPASTPWCTAFVNSVLNAQGLGTTKSLAAKSYLNYGQAVERPELGDIVVMNRAGNPDPNLGHVGFFAGYDKNGKILVTGGNQNDTVSTKPFDPSRVVGYRRPPTGQQIQQYSQQNGIQDPNQLAQLPAQINRSQALKVYNKDPGVMYKLNERQTGPGDLQHVMAGIASVESGGAKDPYRVISKASRNGDRAYGKYQIMGNNIPSWSREAIGRPLSPQEFLANPELQEKIAEYHIGKNLQKYGNIDDAFSVWFSGRPAAKAGNARDVYGTTVPDYIKRARQGYLKSLDAGSIGAVPGGDMQRPIDAGVGVITQNQQPGLLQTLGTMLANSKSPYDAPDQLPGTINPPVYKDFNDLMRWMDNGRDDYASAQIPLSKGIRWELLNPKPKTV